MSNVSKALPASNGKQSKLFQALADLEQHCKTELSSILKDCTELHSEEMRVAYTLGLHMDKVNPEHSLFSPENYPANNPAYYSMAFELGKRRGQELHKLFLKTLDRVAAPNKSVTHNKGEK